MALYNYTDSYDLCNFYYPGGKMTIRSLIGRLFNIGLQINIEEPCVCGGNMHIDTQSGSWYCDTCDLSGDLFKLYSITTGKSLAISTREVLFFTSYANTEIYWEKDIFSLIIRNNKDFIKPHVSLRKIGEWHRDLNNDDMFKKEIEVLCGISQEEVAQNRLGRIIHNRRKILVWPIFVLGELDAVYFIAPYTGQKLGEKNE